MPGGGRGSQEASHPSLCLAVEQCVLSGVPSVAKCVSVLRKPRASNTPGLEETEGFWRFPAGLFSVGGGGEEDLEEGVSPPFCAWSPFSPGFFPLLPLAIPPQRCS